MILYAVGTFNFILNFFIIFAGSFGRFSVNQTLALGELPLHNTTPATIGKLEWLTIIIWTIILLTDAMTIALTARTCLDTAINNNVNKFSPYVTSGIIIAIVGLTYMQLETLIEFATTPMFSTIAGGVQISAVLLLVVADLIIKKRGSQKSNTNVAKEKRGARCSN